MRRTLLFAGMLAVLTCGPALAQRETRPSLEAAAIRPAAVHGTLRRLLSPAGIEVPEASSLPRDARTQELHLAWESPQAVAGQPAQPTPMAAPRVLARTRRAGAFPRLRSLELTEEKIFVAALDASGALRGWSLIPDPRFVRFEEPGPDGVLTGRIVAVEHPEFLAQVPDDGTVVEIRLFEPRRSGETFTLVPVAAITLTSSGGAGGD
jgi:hypothetical protein